jgi:hypothetical protein
MVGIELRRAGCRWRVTKPALAIESGGSHFHHGLRFRRLPYNAGRPNFLGPGVTALEHQSRSSGSVHLTFSWTLSNTVNPHAYPTTAYLRLVRGLTWRPHRDSASHIQGYLVQGKQRSSSHAWTKFGMQLAPWKMFAHFTGQAPRT